MQYKFGAHLLDPERRELTRGTEAVAVGPQVFDLLLHLVRSRMRVVSKDELLDVVWRGRTVSESTLTSHINAVRKAVGDSGGEQQLVRTVARKGFRFVGDVVELPSPESTKSDGASPSKAPEQEPAPIDKPSIAVLPFLNLSGDADQDYFADGTVEDIIAALSRIGWLFVIARNSSFTFKGRAVDVKQVGRELGVRYVLEGSVRRAARRVRITGQLIDATTGGHLWAERFESTQDDIFALQDEVVASVVGAIAPQLERAEIERAKRKPTASLDAYDYYLQGMWHFHRRSSEAIDAALMLFHRAIALDAEFASAYGMAAWSLFWRKINGWMADHPQETTQGAHLARRAVELGRNDPVALTRGGHALGHFGGDLHSCVALLDRALVLDPNQSAAWYLGGFQRISLGEHDNAIRHFTHAMRLSPLDPEMVRMQTGMALAHLLAGRPDTALAWAERASGDMPDFLLAVAVIAACHALSGRADEAQRAMRQLRGLDPTLRVGNLPGWILLHRAQDLATFADGLRGAGLPD